MRGKLEVREVNPDFVKNGTAFALQVFAPRGDALEVHVTSDFTIREVLDLVAFKLDMWQYEIWSLCRPGKSGEGFKSVVRGEDGVLSEVNVMWLDVAKSVEEYGFKANDMLYFRVKYFKLYFKLVDAVAIEMYFSQVNAEVLSGLYPSTSSKVAVRLAAMQLQAESGDFNRMTHKPGYFNEAVLARFLPQRVLERNTATSSEYLQQRIFFYHRRLVGTAKVNAQLAYIVESRNLSTWGATWFEAKLIRYKSQLARRILIGVCEDGFVLPLRPAGVNEEEEKKRTLTRRKLIESARANSIMNMSSVLDAVELGMLQQKADDEQIEFFGFDATYLEETDMGLLLKKKGEEVELGISKRQLNEVLALADSYMWMLGKQGWKSMVEDDVPEHSPDCPDYRLFDAPMNRSVAKKELKKGKTMLEMLRENYLEATTVAKRAPVDRLLLQIEVHLDERRVLQELDLKRAQMNDESFALISESIAATYQVVMSTQDTMKFENDLVPNALILSFNDLENPDGLGDMCAALRIQRLLLRSNNLSPKWATNFAKSVVKCTGLLEIDLSDNRIGNDGTIDILNSLVTLPAIRSVSLSNVGMTNSSIKRSISKISTGPDRGTLRGLPGGPGPEMGKVIASLIINAAKLEKLDVSDNVLTARGVDFIVDALERTDSCKDRLIELNLGNTHISGSVGERLVTWVSKAVLDARNHLAVLDLNANALTHPACTTLATLFTAVTVRLKEVNFSYLKMAADSVATLLAGLEKNKTVTSMNLSYNDISSKLAKALAHVVQNNANIVKLSLRNCSMEKACIVSLGDAMAKNSSILELDVAGNNFEAAACGASWEAALRKNATLTQLNMAACNLDGDSVDNLAAALRVNRTLQMLHLDANYIGARGLKKLGHALRDNHALRVLSLQEVDCKYKDTCIFIQELADTASTTGIQTLDLRQNPDLTANAHAFAETVAQHNSLGIRYTQKGSQATQQGNNNNNNYFYTGGTFRNGKSSTTTITPAKPTTTPSSSSK